MDASDSLENASRYSFATTLHAITSLDSGEILCSTDHKVIGMPVTASVGWFF